MNKEIQKKIQEIKNTEEHSGLIDAIWRRSKKGGTPFYSFEVLKELYNERLNAPFAVIEQVIEQMKNEFIKPVKNPESPYLFYYQSLTAGKTPEIWKDENIRDLATVIEAIKFERYLLKENYNTTSFISRQPETKTPKKHTGKIYAISYILDCRADEDLKKKDVQLKQDEKEEVFWKRCNGILSGNTIRQEVTKIKHNIFTDLDFTEMIGNDWKEILLKLSATPEKLEIYLENECF